MASFDSGRPINSHYRYESGTHDGEFNTSAAQTYGYDTPARTAGKSGSSRGKWLKIGIPVLIVLIIAGVVAGVVISKHNDNSKTSSTGGGGSGNSTSGGGSGGGGGGKNLGVFFTATDAYGLPVYPTTTNSALFGAPTFNPSATVSWPADTTSFAAPTPTSVRADHPRLIAPKYKWDALPDMISKDPYLASWNDTIFGNASVVLGQDPLIYAIDGGLGGSGVLDIARETKMRIKSLAYAYRMSNETKYADRAWRELQNAAGNTTNYFGNAGDNWNTEHFLDVGEFTAAFAIGYDWLYDYWTPTQRTAIMYSILDLGIYWGIQGYTNTSVWFAWWRLPGNMNGNWNCVCNNGLTMGALAIIDEDPTGMAAQMLSLTLPNALAGCIYGPSSDGTWSETANYWYFGTQAHAEMTSSLMTATGSDYGMLHNNPSFNDTGLFHMYVTGMTSLFNYGDHGPNKYSTTANAMMFYGAQFNIPQYVLHQRDRIDAPEPHGLFWYDPTVSGAFWDGMPLDHYFDNGLDQWASMRTSWTDDTGLYVAMKAGNHTGHQTHGDLDAGDWVFDAMGQRWAGELGSGNYLSDGYFSNETQTSERWLYYRKRTEGQNTIVVDKQNQNVNAQPTTTFGTTGETQPGDTTVYSVPSTSKAFFTCDLTTTYFGTSVNRGIRLLNGRKQVLVQDDITNANLASEWRMHTNATVDLNGTTATLTLEGKTVIATILNAPSGVVFSKGPAVRYASDPPLPSDPASQDQENLGVTVLMIEIPTGTNSIQVLFNPQWDGMSASDFVTPPSVPVSSWTLTSHDSN